VSRHDHLRPLYKIFKACHTIEFFPRRLFKAVWYVHMQIWSGSGRRNPHKFPKRREYALDLFGKVRYTFGALIRSTVLCVQSLQI
jgi:hypothetical protein